MKTGRTLSFPEKKAAAKRPFDLESINSSAYSALSQNEPINCGTNCVINFDTVLPGICSNCLMPFRTQTNIEVSGKRLLRNKIFFLAILQIIVNCLTKSSLKLLQSLSLVNQSSTNSQHFSGQQIIREIEINRALISSVFKCISSHKYPIFRKVSTILRIVPLPITFFGCGRAQKMTSLLLRWETKRPWEPPLSPCHSKPNEISTEQSSSKVKSEGGGALMSRAINFSVLVTKHLASVTNFSNKTVTLQLFFLFCLTLVCCPSHADDFGELAKRCAPSVAEDTLRAIVKTESGFNPYAIGVVKGKVKQPKAYHEAMSTIAELELSGADYSVGLAQINRKNFSKYGISASQALDACTNLKVASRILSACFKSAKQSPASDGKALHDALSCYYSGNFKTGYRHGYVDKVRSNAGLSPLSVPSIREVEVSKPQQSLIAEGVTGKSSGLIF